jgi:chromate transporter
VSLREAFRVWLRVAMLSFGGSAGQIAVMHRILVEEKRWISEAVSARAQLLHAAARPRGAAAATYIGWLMHRTLGGIMAGVLFCAPGLVAIAGAQLRLCRLRQRAGDCGGVFRAQGRGP